MSSPVAMPATAPSPTPSALAQAPQSATPASSAPDSFRAPLSDFAANAPANAFANLSPSDCRDRLDAEGLPFVRDPAPTGGVASAYRFDGPLRGIRFISHPAPIPFGILDCRLALLMDAFAATLARHDVAEVRVDNMYRPQAKLPGRSKSSQHAHGLAIDIMSITLRDGRTLVVEEDWSAPRGAAICGPDAVMDPATDKAIALRNIVCDVASSGLFHHMLTPSYDAAHRNHFHFDIKRDATRRSLH